MYKNIQWYFSFLITLLIFLGLQSCSTDQNLSSSIPVKPYTTHHDEYRYLIGPGDSLNIFVWKNDEISTSVIVRPDGMINSPLVEDIKVSDKTPSQVARLIEEVLAKYIREPIVTVTVGGFVGPYHEQVRVIGEAAEPQSLPYSEGMTLLDVIIAVGGLTEFADGNDAVLSRVVDGNYQQYTILMEDLIQKGDMNANVNILPGDIIVIPETWF